MNNIVMRSSEAQNTRIVVIDNYYMYIGTLSHMYMTSTNGEICPVPFLRLLSLEYYEENREN